MEAMAAFRGINGVVDISSFVIEVDQAPQAVRHCLELVTTCHNALQQLISLRNKHLDYLSTTHQEDLDQVHAVIAAADNGLAAVATLVEKCRPDAADGSTSFGQRVRWVWADKKQFEFQQPLVSRHHAAVLAEIGNIRQIMRLKDLAQKVVGPAAGGGGLRQCKTANKGAFEDMGALADILGSGGTNGMGQGWSPPAAFSGPTPAAGAVPGQQGVGAVSSTPLGQERKQTTSGSTATGVVMPTNGGIWVGGSGGHTQSSPVLGHTVSQPSALSQQQSILPIHRDQSVPLQQTQTIQLTNTGIAMPSTGRHAARHSIAQSTPSRPASILSSNPQSPPATIYHGVTGGAVVAQQQSLNPTVAGQAQSYTSVPGSVSQSQIYHATTLGAVQNAPIQPQKTQPMTESFVGVGTGVVQPSPGTGQVYVSPQSGYQQPQVTGATGQAQVSTYTTPTYTNQVPIVPGKAGVVGGSLVWSEGQPVSQLSSGGQSCVQPQASMPDLRGQSQQQEQQQYLQSVSQPSSGGQSFVQPHFSMMDIRGPAQQHQPQAQQQQQQQQQQHCHSVIGTIVQSVTPQTVVRKPVPPAYNSGVAGSMLGQTVLAQPQSQAQVPHPQRFGGVLPGVSQQLTPKRHNEVASQPYMNSLGQATGSQQVSQVGYSPVSAATTQLVQTHPVLSVPSSSAIAAPTTNLATTAPIGHLLTMTTTTAPTSTATLPPDIPQQVPQQVPVARSPTPLQQVPLSTIPDSMIYNQVPPAATTAAGQSFPSTTTAAVQKFSVQGQQGVPLSQPVAEKPLPPAPRDSVSHDGGCMFTASFASGAVQATSSTSVSSTHTPPQVTVPCLIPGSVPLSADTAQRFQQHQPQAPVATSVSQQTSNPKVTAPINVVYGDGFSCTAAPSDYDQGQPQAQTQTLAQQTSPRPAPTTMTDLTPSTVMTTPSTLFSPTSTMAMVSPAPSTVATVSTVCGKDDEYQDNSVMGASWGVSGGAHLAGDHPGQENHIPSRVEFVAESRMAKPVAADSDDYFASFMYLGPTPPSPSSSYVPTQYNFVAQKKEEVERVTQRERKWKATVEDCEEGSDEPAQIVQEVRAQEEKREVLSANHGKQGGNDGKIWGGVSRKVDGGEQSERVGGEGEEHWQQAGMFAGWGYGGQPSAKGEAVGRISRGCEKATEDENGKTEVQQQAQQEQELAKQQHKSQSPDAFQAPPAPKPNQEGHPQAPAQAPPPCSCSHNYNRDHNPIYNYGGAPQGPPGPYQQCGPGPDQCQPLPHQHHPGQDYGGPNPYYPQNPDYRHQHYLPPGVTTVVGGGTYPHPHHYQHPPKPPHFPPYNTHLPARLPGSSAPGGAGLGQYQVAAQQGRSTGKYGGAAIVAPNPPAGVGELGSENYYAGSWGGQVIEME